jgi:hypothetical protein
MNMTKKAETALAIRNTASIAATAWNRLETAATKAMATNGHAPAMQLVADDRGITAIVTDAHGTTVTIQGGKVSVAVEANKESE